PRLSYDPPTWLYRIATNACLDFLDKRADRTPVPSGLPDAGSEVLHLQPFPDPMLPEDPQESAVAREAIELAFIVAVQHLPPRQRAGFVLRDVLGWRATTVADALELTVASVTSALQRARGTMRERLPDRRLDWRSPATHELSDDERRVVRSYIDAHERGDLAALTSLLRADLRFAMLPDPGTVTTTAKDAVDGWVSGGLFRRGRDDWRGITTAVNRMPAAALYLRAPGEPEHRLFAVAALRVVDDKVAELTGFDATDQAWLGVPPALGSTEAGPSARRQGREGPLHAQVEGVDEGGEPVELAPQGRRGGLQQREAGAQELVGGLPAGGGGTADARDGDPVVEQRHAQHRDPEV